MRFINLYPNQGGLGQTLSIAQGPSRTRTRGIILSNCMCSNKLAGKFVT